jgi:hypothetical protein
MTYSIDVVVRSQALVFVCLFKVDIDLESIGFK